MTSREQATKLIRDNASLLKWGVAAIIAVFVAAGFGFKTPQQTFAAIDQRIAANALAIVTNKLSADSTRQQLQDANLKLDIMLKLQCVDGRISRRDLQLVGLDCAKVLGGPGQ